MILQKIYWHLNALIKIMLYRVIFGKALTFPLSSTFRERFNLTVGGGKINIGKNVFFNHDCSITCEDSTITIGEGTIFGEGVKIYCHNHKYKDTTRPIKEQGYSTAPVTIGKHCWIGSNVVILKGVNIGNNSVVGAGCVVYKNVDANTVVVNKQNLVIQQFRTMNNPLITVIVPCYNVELYLPRCVDSILNQTYKNLEIFLVDDGSPDRCGEICDEYARQDKRIKVIHKENGGLSDARNVAIDVATGEYIVFVDSDDFVALDYVETLYQLATDNDAQVAVTWLKCFDEGTGPVADTHNGKTLKVFTAEEALLSMFYQKDFDTAACAKIYHHSLFEGIRYPEGWLYEDLSTTYRLMMKCRRVAFSNYMSYYYLLRKSSIEGSPFKPAKFESCMNIVNQLKRDRSAMPINIQRAMNCRIVSLVFHILLDVPMEQKDMRKTLINEIRPLRWSVLFDRKARKKARLACLLSFFGLNAIQLARRKASAMSLSLFQRNTNSGG